MEKSKKIYIVINFTGLEKQMFIIADLKNKENLKAIYTADFKDLETLEALLKVAEQQKAEGYIIMFGGISESGLFKEPFKMEKHFNILAVAMEKLKEKALNNPLKQELKNLENEFKAVDTRKIFSKLSEILKKYFVEVAGLPEKMQPQTDRDFLDLSIEMYKLLYAKAYNMNYADDKIDDVVMKEPFMDLLLEYKFNYYGHEIFGTYGFNIVDRLENGNIKISEMTEEEREIQKILN